MIKGIVGTTIIWSALAAISPLSAQQKEDTLGEIWLKVEQYYPGIHSKNSSIEAAKYQADYVKMNTLPQVKAQIQNTYSTYNGTSGAFFSLPGLFNVAGSASAIEGSSVVPNSYGSATMDWEIFTFGKNRKEQEAAGMLYQKASNEKEAYLLKLKKELSDRYITLLHTSAKLDWKGKNVKRLENISSLTAGLSASGLRPAADSLLATSTYTQALGDFIKLEGLEEAKRLQVLELYGENAIIYAGALNKFMFPLGNATSAGTVNTVEKHPSLVVLDNQASYYGLQADVQKRTALPSLHLLGGYSFRGTGISQQGIVSSAWSNGFKNTNSNFIAGLGLTWNITNLHSSNLKREQLNKEAEGTLFLKKQYELAINTALSASLVKLVKQYAQYQKSTVAVKQSQDAFGMYLARYKSGLITLSELLQIQGLLEQAENNHIDVSRDYWLLLAQEAELTGNFDFLFTNL